MKHLFTIFSLFLFVSCGQEQEGSKVQCPAANTPDSDGYEKWVDQYGNLISEGNWENCNRQGKHISYYENGVIAEITNYKDGIMIWTERYSTNGKIELKGHFNEKLIKHGEWIYYYNGKPDVTFTFKDGKQIKKTIH